MTIAAKIAAAALSPFMLFSGATSGTLAQHDTSNNWMTVDTQNTQVHIVGIDGPSTLAVHATGTWTVHASETSTSSLHYTVRWGDEGKEILPLAMSAGTTTQSATFTHAYATAGVYTPVFTVSDDLGNTVTKAAASVSVGKVKVQNAHITAISPASGSAGTVVTLMGRNFASTSEVSLNGTLVPATVSSSTSLTFTVPTTMPNGWYRVRVVTDAHKSNVVWFHVTSPAAVHLSVTGLDAPAVLTTNEAGTWTLHAATNVTGTLHYSVVWGDENTMMHALSTLAPLTQTSATFTHTYATAGTYAPKFTVTDDAGHTATVGATVQVQNPS